MPISILMPALSPTMEEGTLAKWHVKEGDSVTSGDILAEIETDKATMEVEAVDEGTIGKIVINEGTEGVAVNTTIAILLEEGESSDDLDKVSDSPQPEKPSEKAAINGDGGAASIAQDETGTTKQSTQHTVASPHQASSASSGRVFASPLARRLADEKGLNLETIAGTGPNNRIVKRDVTKALESGAPVQAQELVRADTQAQKLPAAVQGMSDSQILALYDSGSYEIVPHDNMRRIIATRLVESKQTIPHFYLTLDCELDQLLISRKRMNEAAPKEGPNAFRLSVNDFVIKAMAMALQQVPEANATWTEQGTLRHKSSDVGVAVAVEGGLFTPVIRHAELKSLSEISNEMKELAERARNRRLAPHEYQGGVTSISNLGMYGISKFDAVINPPHSSILAVGMGEKRPVVKGGELTVATVMTVTLSCDHRVVDGAIGADLLNAFKQFIDDPVTMLV